MKIYVFNIGMYYDSIFEIVVADTQREAVTMLENKVKEEWDNNKNQYLMSYKKNGEDTWRRESTKALKAVSLGFVGELPIEKGVLTRKYNVNISHIE
jgi:hypothetical protein